MSAAEVAKAAQLRGRLLGTGDDAFKPASGAGFKGGHQSMGGLPYGDHGNLAERVQVIEVFAYTQNAAFALHVAAENILDAGLSQRLVKKAARQEAHFRYQRRVWRERHDCGIIEVRLDLAGIISQVAIRLFTSYNLIAMRASKFAAVVLPLLVGCSLFLACRSATGNQDKPHAATLTWKPSPNATSYNIYRSQVAGGPYKKIGSSKEAKYVDTPLPSGEAFFYVVTAVSGEKESSYSAEIRIKVP